MGETRDAGLVRAVGPLALAAGTISMIVGAGIFAAPRELAASVGAYAPWAALGPLAGYVAGTLLWVGDVLFMSPGALRHGFSPAKASRWRARHSHRPSLADPRRIRTQRD